MNGRPFYAKPLNLGNNPPIRIPAFGSIDVKMLSDIDDSVSNVLFRLDTNDTDQSGITIPMIDERNYDNNSYILSLN